MARGVGFCPHISPRRSHCHTALHPSLPCPSRARTTPAQAQKWTRAADAQPREDTTRLVDGGDGLLDRLLEAVGAAGNAKLRAALLCAQARADEQARGAAAADGAAAGAADDAAVDGEQEAWEHVEDENDNAMRD
jgi:hypothetical protein